MITRLEVDGFKSLRDFAVDLEPFTVLVGPNDAGKSNILEALALAARLRRSSPEEALKQGRGRANDQFSRQGAVSFPVLSLTVECLELELDERGANGMTRRAERQRHNLVLDRTTRVRGIERVDLHHSMLPIAPADDRWLHAHPEWNAFVTPPDLSKLLPTNWLPPHIDLIQLHASQLREPSEMIDSGTLAADASNLPSVLAGLSDVELGRVRAALVGLIPGIADFDIVPHEDRLEIAFRTREGERVPARLASDGTLRVLGLLTAVLTRPPESRDLIVCIEEPENGIYPGRLTRLIDILRDATDSAPWREGDVDPPPPQVILTTHSPVALDALRQHRDAIRFIDTIVRDGVRFTRARRVVEDTAVSNRMTEASIREIDLRLRTTTHDEER
jgi:predicted ATPase